MRRLRFLPFSVVLLALFSAPLWKAGPAVAQGVPPLCDTCQVAEDPCSAGQPTYADTAFTNYFTYSDRLVANTGWVLVPGDPVLSIFDLGPPRPTPAPNVNWYAPRFTGPGGSWNQQNLGSIFGITFDTVGNIYVTHSAAYSLYGAPAAMADFTGPGGVGAIYKIANGTGAISVFCQLPNYQDNSGPMLSHAASDRYPGLGNITYDPTNQQFFVTNMEDGRIYRISPAGVILSTYDPGASDPGPTNTINLPPPNAIGAAPLGERLWAVKWHGNRVYYSRWTRDAGHPSTQPNEIRSVGLNGSGDFIGWDDRLEVQLPAWTTNISNPVADMAFSVNGTMLLAERGMTDVTTTTPHQSRLLEYICQNGVWVPEPVNKFTGGTVAPFSSAGGCDYDRAPFNTGGPDPYGRVWGTFDALFASAPPWIYGLEALPPTGGNIANSYCIDIDLDVSTHDKQLVGDVAIPCPPSSQNGEINGHKFNDLNHNGVQDGGEPNLAGWQITISGPVSFTVTTDAFGNYSFGSLPPGTYTVCEVTQPGFILTTPASGCYTITIVAGQVVTNVNFGNYRCIDDLPCVDPPSCTVGWWPFDENTGTIANDVASNNDGTLVGGPTWIGGQYVNNSLQFLSTTTYVEVFPTNTVLNFGTKSFSMDAWIRTQAQTNYDRTIIDRRMGPAATPRGFRLYLSSDRLALQVGTGGPPVDFINTGGPSLADGVWHHVAATVCRDQSPVGPIVTLYIDGSPVQVFGGVPTGSVTATAATPLRFGQACPAFTPQPFEGRIDEPELFNCCLKDAQIQSLFHAGAKGKCRDFCYVPSVTTVSPLATTASITLTIFNAATYAQSFNWTIAGLPAGGICTMNGPTVFSPVAGSVTVGASTWMNIPITVTLPSGMTSADMTCFQVTVFNTKTLGCCTTRGGIQKKKIHIPNGDFTTLPESLATGFTFQVQNSDPVTYDMSYEISDQPGTGDAGDAKVRLNGLPPGEPVIGTLSVAPSGSVTPLDFSAEFIDHQPFLIHEIVLSGDLDGDGVPEPLAVQPVLFMQPGGVSGAVESPPLEPSTQIQASPNPFRSRTAVGVTVSRDQGAVVAVFDVSGRLVRRLYDGRLTAGSHSFEWDGRSETGEEVQQGIYFIRVRSEGSAFTTKVVRLN